jgi:hypothetical protein
LFGENFEKNKIRISLIYWLYPWITDYYFLHAKKALF